MQPIPSLADMRVQLSKLAAWGPGSRTFGLMYCQGCGCQRPFVSCDAHCQHITDAGCETCGHVYGRIDMPDVNRGEVGPDGAVVQVFRPGAKRAPVISDAVASAAAQAWRDQLGARSEPAVAPPRPMPAMPREDDVNDSSRVASYMRTQKAR